MSLHIKGISVSSTWCPNSGVPLTEGSIVSLLILYCDAQQRLGCLEILFPRFGVMYAVWDWYMLGNAIQRYWMWATSEGFNSSIEGVRIRVKVRVSG